MAITFISPKTRQRTFFWGISVALVIFFIAMFAVVLLPTLNTKPQSVSSSTLFYKPNVQIDFTTIDSPEVKNLQPFPTMQNQFTYVVEDSSGKQVTGNISADSQTDAQQLLEASGDKIISIQEVDIGRSQPFVSY